MDHIGAHHLHQSHAEPISFGIDQILNNPDQGSCMISGSRLQDSSDYGLSCIVSSAYNTMTGSYGASGGSAGAYPGACSMASLPGSYNVNMGVAMNGNGLNSAGGVIRVPAHRPLAGGGHQPLSTGMPTVPSVNAMNNLTGLTFPWMESNRRYTKDRFTGESRPLASRAGQPGSPASLSGSPPRYAGPTWGATAGSLPAAPDSPVPWPPPRCPFQTAGIGRARLQGRDPLIPG